MPNQEGCSIDNRYRARCNLVQQGSPLPSEFQYFPDDPTLGGSMPYLDFCPVFYRLGSGDCMSPDTTGFWFFGEQAGSASRCFTGTYQRDTLTRTPTGHAGCLRIECTSNNFLRVFLVGMFGEERAVTCPLAGGTVDLTTVISDFVGTLECPPANEFCTGNPCDVNNCNGHGICSPSTGTCTC